VQKQKASLAVIFGIVFIDLVGFGIVIPVLPLYAERFGASPLVIGLLLAVYSLMSFLFAPVLGRWSDRIGRRPVLLISILGSSVGFLIMGLAGSLPFLFLEIFVGFVQALVFAMLTLVNLNMAVQHHGAEH
jgi:MFS family permease